MAFKSDKQRRGFFGSRGTVKSAVAPTLVFGTGRGFINPKTKLLKARFEPIEKKGITGESLFVKVEAISKNKRFGIAKLKNQPLTSSAKFNDRVLIKSIKKKEIPVIIGTGTKKSKIFFDFVKI